MKGITTSERDVSRLLGRAALVGSLLLSVAAWGDEPAGTVQISDDAFAAPIEGECPPPLNCPPYWLPEALPAPGAMPPQMPPRQSAPRQSAPRQTPPATDSTRPQPTRPSPSDRSQPSPSDQSQARQPQSSPQQSRQQPQSNQQSPNQSPSNAGAQSGQPGQSGVSQASYSTGALSAPAAQSSAAPNMLADFFGSISSKPTILPGNLVGQAIFFQPMQVSGGPVLLDYYRSVTEIDPVNNPGTFQTNQFVYLASVNGQLVDAVPTRVPPQLLQEYDDVNGFAGNPVFITGGPDPADPTMTIPPAPVSNPGPLIALDSGDTADVVDVVTAEGPAVLVDEPLFNIYDALLIFIPSPGSGGGVGRQKIAENTSPIPRDRVFINHSSFFNVPLTQGGVNVYRFSPGIEKAFHEERFSIEVRFPFASTLDSDISAFGGTDQQATEFGNIVTTLKALVSRSVSSAVAVGVSVTAPTHADLVVEDLRGAPLFTIENESVHVMPFIGGTHSRGRCFTEWFLQGDLDTTGSPVAIRDVLTDTLNDAGTLNDAAFLYASLSTGYWIYQNGHRATSFASYPGRSIKRTIYTGGTGITGFAPLIEVHFNQSLDKGETITSGPIQYQAPTDFSLTNLVLGGVMTFGTGGSISAGWGTPVLGQDDKQFDNEFRLIFDYEY